MERSTTCVGTVIDATPVWLTPKGGASRGLRDAPRCVEIEREDMACDS
jgi:hypothetical protein